MTQLFVKIHSVSTATDPVMSSEIAVVGVEGDIGEIKFLH